MNIKNLLIKLRPFTLLIAIVSGFIVFLMFNVIYCMKMILQRNDFFLILIYTIWNLNAI